MFPWLSWPNAHGPFRFPFSGDVTQAINPWSWAFQNPTFGLINIVAGNPGNAEAEAKILDDVGSYGRQIGRLADAVDVLLSTVDIRTLTKEQAAAIALFKDQLEAVRAIKAQKTNRRYPSLSEPPPQGLP